MTKAGLFRIAPRVVRILKSALALSTSYVFYQMVGRFQTRAPARNSAELDQIFRGSSARQSSVSPHPSQIRISSWNIQYGRSFDRIRQALLGELFSDIYLLQEVDCHNRRSGFQAIAASLSRELQFNFVFGCEFQELSQSKGGVPALHGQAILSRYPILQPAVLRFQNRPMDWSKSHFQPRSGGRMALQATLKTGPTTILLYNTHLESRGSEKGRAAQMQEILADLACLPNHMPTLIGGDFNTKQEDSETIRLLEGADFQDVFRGEGGHRSTTFEGCLDWMFLRNLEVIEAKTHHTISGSDHKPISALFRLA